MREEIVERYVKTFAAWRAEVLDLQDQVDAIVFGDVSAIEDWDGDAAQSLLESKTRIPTGYVLEGMAEFSMIGYEGQDLVLNNKIAQNAGVKFSRGLLKKADRVID
jgi:hypothetical protein